MPITLKEAIKRSFLFDLIRPLKQRIEVSRWERSGRPVPPPSKIKQQIVASYAERFGPRVLVETGTYLGDMIHAIKDRFDRVYSVELDPHLHARAVRRFARWPHVKLLRGDSGEVLARVLAELDQPALFWLDAHYSGGITARAALDTPVARELELIMSHRVPNHVVLIDDARAFGVDSNYPSIGELERIVKARRPGWTVQVESDIVRLHEAK